jgi:pilus assembly protein CpaE
LIVDDIAETRENIKRMLQFDASIEVIGSARSGKEALELVPQLKPDVVLMDINMPDMDGIQATEAVRRKIPWIQVIILSVQNDASYMRRAMQAGAHDFLTKPSAIDELTAAIRRAGIMAENERTKAAQGFPGGGTASGTASASSGGKRGKIIVVFSPKGGTGCTTLAVNLGIALHSEESKVCLVDASLQFGDLAVFMNEQVKNNVLDLASRVDDLDLEVVQEVMIKHTATGIHLLAAPNKPEQADNVKADQFTKLLNFLRQIYAYVIVDTSSYLTEVVLNALDISNLIILNTSQEIPAIKNCNLFLTLAEALGIKRDRILFTMNRYDKRILITPERVGESLRQPILCTIPFDDKIVTTSVNRGVPFIIEYKTQPIGKAIMTLADLTREKLTKLAASEETPIPGKK